MSEQSAGEKTEKATSKRLEEALKKGQIARSPEVQTVFVLGGAMLALGMTGAETWRTMAQSCASTLGHLHDTPVTLDAMQGYTITGALALGHCVLPVMVATVTGGLLAGGIQTRFRASSEALQVNWERLNPVEGLKRLFSMRSTVATCLGIVKLTVVLTLCYNVIKKVLSDPIFYSSVDVARIASFMAESSFKIVLQVGVALIILAAVDYSYKFWQTNQDLKMTREEVKEENKNTEGDPAVKARMRRRRITMTKRKMLAEVPKADVVVTNPTHIAIALRYDRKSMKAPKIVAKGIRLNAQQIREIAKEHQVPIIENKPLAQLMFKYGRVGGEIPAQLYAAVAEILAWVYRVNAYRYYREKSMSDS
ncbi:MAG TPA: flagellar biosynthesis protein FlhB [Candidatus Cybelea sp.]|jgi:flagellar biosynthetic protein FlhB|nr:flagellar biosynthesis protein FlhB [Candidatus Cybelea sp.]